MNPKVYGIFTFMHFFFMIFSHQTSYHFCHCIYLQVFIFLTCIKAAEDLSHSWIASFSMEIKALIKDDVYKDAIHLGYQQFSKFGSIRFTWFLSGNKDSQYYSSYTESKFVAVCVLVTQLCPTLCDPTDCSPPVSSIHGIFQARILEQIAIPFSRGSSQASLKSLLQHHSSKALSFLYSPALTSIQDYWKNHSYLRRFRRGDLQREEGLSHGEE